MFNLNKTAAGAVKAATGTDVVKEMTLVWARKGGLVNVARDCSIGLESLQNWAGGAGAAPTRAQLDALVDIFWGGAFLLDHESDLLTSTPKPPVQTLPRYTNFVPPPPPPRAPPGITIVRDALPSSPPVQRPGWAPPR